MNKKIILYLGVLFISLGVTACATERDESNENTVKNELEQDFSENEEFEIPSAIPEKEPETQDDEKTEINEDNREISFNGDVIINEDVILILKNDGTVWGKGRNTSGALGNGKRVDSDTWVQVVDIDNVVGIYAAINFGMKNKEEYHCYALCEDGTLYRWGGNIFIPEKVECLSDVVKVNRPYQDDCYMTVECIDGSKYVMIDSYSDSIGWDDIFVPYKSEFSDDIFCDEYHLSNGKLTYFYGHNGLGRQYNTSVQEVCVSDVSYEERMDAGLFASLLEIEDIDVKSVRGNYFLDMKGSVYHFDWKVTDDDPTMDDVKNYGGSGYVQWIVIGNLRDGTEISLFSKGTLKTRGNNEYGELGDGTYEELRGTDYTVSEALFKMIKSDGEFVSAIDFDGNVWAWGRGYGATPRIVISKNDFTMEW